jgi:hypothetical protein
MRIRLNLPSNLVAPGEHGNGAWHIVARAIALLMVIAACNNATGQNASFGVAPTVATPPNATGSGVITLGTETYKVVDATDLTFPPTDLHGEKNSVIQVGCQSCQTQSCQGNCRGGRRGSYPTGNFCAPCEPFCYVSVETLFMQRQSANFTASPNFLMDDFGFEVIPRLTIGRVPDCINGCELTFTGVAEWTQSGSASNPTGGIETFLNPVSPFDSTDITAYVNSIEQSQKLEAQYWSVEANRTLVGYDIARCLFGVRYIDYQERFTYLGENATPGGLTGTTLGSLTSDVKNRLIGPQVGVDLLYPICRRGYTDFRARGGVFANFADLDFDYRNNLDTALLADEDKVTVSGMLEIAGGLRFQVTDCISIRAGGELWWLGGVATATDQFRNTIGGINSVRTGSDFFVAGGTLGAEFRY